MESLRIRRPVVALALTGLLLGGPAACGGENKPEGLPSNRPSVEFSADRTARPAPTGDETTETSEPEPTRTRETRTADPTKTTEATEPTKTREPTKTPEPAKTQKPTKTQEPADTQEPRPAATSSSAVAAGTVSGEDDGGDGGVWGWLLLIALLTGLVGALLYGRNRKVTAWDGEARGLAGETRTVLGVRLPPVLTATGPGQRGLAWPPVRDDLTALEARWAAILPTAPDDERSSYAGGIGGMLRDLVIAVDAENEAVAAGRDWQMLRPRLDAILAALTAALEPAPAAATVHPPQPTAARTPEAPPQPTAPRTPQAPPQPTAPQAPQAPPAATTEYGEPLDADPDDPYGSYPPPRHAAPGDAGPAQPGPSGYPDPDDPGDR
ncbi:hypothetical protein ACTOB_002039 [Actinoplanes oblitus]|uniref:Uncharacterized protein n=1 Tax=Actinoplanes oblitus TaxID=3040509 RepID=A0ABY8WKM2_9ACTN|nr:hypothetical protein [Actinoplanes oblitus]WIM98439.1 hypothetical protein ACTOB_002039 [Actinoplanes oblitus]